MSSYCECRNCALSNPHRTHTLARRALLQCLHLLTTISKSHCPSTFSIYMLLHKVLRRIFTSICGGARLARAMLAMPFALPFVVRPNLHMHSVHM